MMKRNGASLVEVLVAGGLLVAALVPLLDMTTSNQRRTAVSQFQLRAQSWARRAVTGVAALPYDKALELKLGGTTLPELAIATAAPEEFPGELELSVEEVRAGEGGENSLMLKVTARVTWSPYGKQEAKGRGTFVLERLVSMPEAGLVQKLQV